MGITPLVRDRVKETSTDIGTGTLMLLGPEFNFLSFASTYPLNTPFPCTIVHTTAAEFETGYSQLVSSSILQRLAVYTSTNNNAFVNFTSGEKEIFVGLPSELAVMYDLDIQNGYNLFLSGSTSGSFVGPLLGTASYSTNIENIMSPGMYATSASTVVSSSTALSNTGSFTGSFTGVLTGNTSTITGSLSITNAPSVSGLTITGSFAQTGSMKMTGPVNIGTAPSNLGLGGLFVSGFAVASGGLQLPFNVPLFGTNAGIPERILLQAANTYFGAIDFGWQTGSTFIVSDNAVNIQVSRSLMAIFTAAGLQVIGATSSNTPAITIGEQTITSGSNLEFQGAGGYLKGITWLGSSVNNATRWGLYQASDFETVGNTGLALGLFAYDNSGSLIDTALSVNRSGSFSIAPDGLRQVTIGVPGTGSQTLQVSGTSLFYNDVTVGNNFFVSGTAFINPTTASAFLSSSLVFPSNAGIQTTEAGVPRRILLQAINTYFGAIDTGWQIGDTYILSDNAIILQIKGIPAINITNVGPPINAFIAISGSLFVSGSQKNLYSGSSAIALTSGSIGFAVSGSAPRLGTAVLSGGTIKVSTAAVTPTSRIFLSPKAAAGTVGTLTYSASFVDGFTINSTQPSDASTINWIIFDGF